MKITALDLYIIWGKVPLYLLKGRRNKAEMPITSGKGPPKQFVLNDALGGDPGNQQTGQSNQISATFVSHFSNSDVTHTHTNVFIDKWKHFPNLTKTLGIRLHLKFRGDSSPKFRGRDI